MHGLSKSFHIRYWVWCIRQRNSVVISLTIYPICLLSLRPLTFGFLPFRLFFRLVHIYACAPCPHVPPQRWVIFLLRFMVSSFVAWSLVERAFGTFTFLTRKPPVVKKVVSLATELKSFIASGMMIIYSAVSCSFCAEKFLLCLIELLKKLEQRLNAAKTPSIHRTKLFAHKKYRPFIVKKNIRAQSAWLFIKLLGVS